MLRILISDDHQLYREGLAQLVDQLADDLEVVQAGTFPETMKALSDGKRFDLVLIDLKMPRMGEMSGLAAIVRETQGAPVMVVSAFETHDNVQQAMNAGAAGFLPKSSPIAVMLSAFRLVLAGDTYFPADLLWGAAPVLPGPGAASADKDLESVRTRIDMLTHRQRDVLALVGEGRSNKDIADALGISEGTVKVHVGAILKALGTTNRTQAALIAIDFGIAQRRHGAETIRRA